MNIFESVRFLGEGQQAEEYKAKKVKETYETQDRNDKRNKHRYPNDNNGYKSNFGAAYNDEHNPQARQDAQRSFNKDAEAGKQWRDKHEDEAARKLMAYQKVGDYEKKSGHRAPDHYSAVDATHRHMRRHPEQYKESVEFIIKNLKMI